MMTRLKIACLLYVQLQIFHAFSGQVKNLMDESCGICEDHSPK